MNSLTSFVISCSKTSLLFLYLIFVYALSVVSYVSEQSSLFSTSLETKESIPALRVGDRILVGVLFTITGVAIILGI